MQKTNLELSKDPHPGHLTISGRLIVPEFVSLRDVISRVNFSFSFGICRVNTFLGKANLYGHISGQTKCGGCPYRIASLPGGSFPQATPLRFLVTSECPSKAQRELTRNCPRHRACPSFRVHPPQGALPFSLGLLLASPGSVITLDTS